MKTLASALGAKNPLQPQPPKCASSKASAAPAFGHIVASRGQGARPHIPTEEPRAERTKGRERLLRAGAPIADPLDPATRQVAQLAPPQALAGGAGVAGEAPAEVCARTSLEQLLPSLVRKVAWSGDGRRGAVRLELGAGRMAGAQVVVESDDGRVRVQLLAPSGVDSEAWRQRVKMRLSARGLDVESVEAG